MSLNTQWDSIQLQPLDLPYDRTQAELDPEPRLHGGNNTFCTLGGKIIKRPGTILISNTSSTKRCDRLWLYETLDTPPRVYVLGSFYNSGTTKWEIFYNRISGGGGWTAVPSLRDSGASTRPHEVVISRGLAYIKSFPAGASSEKLGTIVFDGTGTPSSKPWGILGPTEPAALFGATTRLSSSMVDAVTTTANVVSGTGFPSVPFDIQVDFEQMTVTNKGTGLNWTVARGANGTTAEEHDENAIVIYRNWSDSNHKVTVNWYWRYVYYFLTSTGHVSSRSPVETNPDQLPSSTGPFFDKIPKFTYTVPNDSNISKIVFGRTTDGGGTYYKLEEFNNPGAGSQTYSDDSLETGVSGGTFADPIPDEVINTASQSPSLTDNSPPPTVLSPLVLGTDTPQASTPITSYAGRLFYGIGNILFFSGNEEIKDGVPEESWPSGLKGNFFRFQYPVTNVISTADSLYIFTLQSIYQLTGTTLESFSVRPIFNNIGHPYGHPRAITRWNDVIAVLTHDYRILLIKDSSGQIISDPLYTDLTDLLNNNSSCEFDFQYFGDIDKEFLLVNGHVKNDTTKSRQWVLDLKKSKGASNFEGFKIFWNTPWTIRSTAMVSGRIDENTSQRRLVFYVWNNNTSAGDLVYWDSTNSTGTDYYHTTGNIGFDFTLETGQFEVPGGNHVNNLRQPACTPNVVGYCYDRTLFNGDSDPQHYYYVDDFWLEPISIESKSPWRRKLSKGYKTMWCPVNQSCQHFALKISKPNSKELFELQNLIIVYEPDGGA